MSSLFTTLRVVLNNEPVVMNYKELDEVIDHLQGLKMKCAVSPILSHSVIKHEVDETLTKLKRLRAA